VGGLALSFSVANMLEFGLLLALLGRRLGGLPGPFWGGLARMALATLACGVALLALLRLSEGALPFLAPGDTYRWPQQFLPLVGWLALAAGVSGAVYAAAAAALRLDELRSVTDRLGRVVKRKT
jgi:putative peptidoglycan lipid II flippase